jgi:hypothetical protein
MRSSPGHRDDVWIPGARAVTAITELLGAPLWQQRTTPFPHWLAHDVFSEPVYRDLEADFVARLVGSAAPGAQQFRRVLPNSEATAILFDPSFEGPLSVFLTAAWRDLIARLTATRLTEHVSGGLHHHLPGDPDGFIHNDFNAGWFVHQPRDDGTVVADRTACRYGTGEPRRPDAAPQPFIRAVSMLFYLANPAWAGTDNGGTGLFAHRDGPVASPAVVVPPVNNSLLLFPCTPYTFHGFLSNRRGPRNSVAMWFHRTRGDAAAQWGEPAVAGAHAARRR